MHFWQRSWSRSTHPINRKLERHASFARRLVWLSAQCIWLAACGGTTNDPSAAGSGGTGASSGSGGLSTGGAVGGGGASGGTSGGTGGATSGVICAGVKCGPKEDCCLNNGVCFDPIANAGACAAPTEASPPGATPCASDSHCNPGEYCQPKNWGICIGTGLCASKTNCPTSSPGAYCACDGKTYQSVQAACAAGVIVIGAAECGVPTNVGGGGMSAGKITTFCGTDAHCSGGYKCCGLTGTCFDPATPVLCTPPPPGTRLSCIDDNDCVGEAEYCYAESCDGPGGCKLRPGGGSCTGELDPVCGCNGKSYVNATCAAVEGVRISHAGNCP